MKNPTTKYLNVYFASVSLDSLIRKYALQNAVLYGGKASVKAVVGKVIAEDPTLKLKAREVSSLTERIVAEVNALTPQDQSDELRRIAPELLEREKTARERKLPDLPNVKDRVVMRLAPYPSGPLHIGNARMAILNDEYVKRYSGKLILVYDDTIGSEEKIPIREAYDYISEGLQWLQVDCHEIIYKSDRMELFYDWGYGLLNEGHAYVCECDARRLRALRERGEECEHRKQSIEENRKKWEDMLDGRFAEGEAVVRIKTDMNHPDPAFRDRVLFRISDREHPRVGNKYKVWPMLELSWAVDDHLLGITHVLRGKELFIEDLMEKWIWDVLGVEGPEFVHYGRMRLKGIGLSKSQVRRDIDSGILTGISDPRTWSLQSLKRRGFRPEAIRSFVLGFGMSLTDIEVPAENLYAENRKLVDAEANRYFFVPDPVKVEIEGLPDLGPARVPLHPEFPERGMREVATGSSVFLSREDFEKHRGQRIRLKDFCNIVLDVKSRFLSLEVEDLPKVQWVHEHLQVEVIMPEGNIVKGLGERNLKDAKEGQIVQFERFGFVRIDSGGEPTITYFAHR